MKRYLAPAVVLSLLLVAFMLLASEQTGTGAWLSNSSKSVGNISAARLELSLNDEGSPLNKDLGTVTPGQSGEFIVNMKNTGSIPGSLCVSSGGLPSGFVVNTSSVCGVNLNPGESTQLVIDWSLPVEAHDNVLIGSFEFSYVFTLTNGFVVKGNIDIKGEILDPTDTFTPTATATLMPTETETPTLMESPLPPTATFTEMPSATDMPVIQTDTPVPTDAPVLTQTDTPVLTDNPVLTQTDTPVPTDDPAVITQTVPSETEASPVD
jgi:hypothetical protein